MNIIHEHFMLLRTDKKLNYCESANDIILTKLYTYCEDAKNSTLKFPIIKDISKDPYVTKMARTHRWVNC